MKKYIFIVTLLSFNSLVFSQVGISTSNPQAALHVDALKNNAGTGVPTTTQQADDFAVTSSGAVGLGTISPNTSSILEMNSSNKGFLPPRIDLLSSTDGTTIANPATGLVVYHKGNASLEAGLYSNIGTPSAPIWNKGQSLTQNEGGHFYKMIYRGATNNASRTLTAGLFEWRIIISGNFQSLQLRLLKAPSTSVTIQGPRIAWAAALTTTAGSNVSWTTLDWDQWKQIDFQSTNASHLLYLDVSTVDDFYRVSFYTRRDAYTSLLVEVY